MSTIDDPITGFHVSMPYSVKCELYRKKSVRWLALSLISLMLLGRYYCYDNPAALESQLKSIMGLNNLEYNALYSVYSLPNIIIALIAGILIDNYGVRKGIFFSCLFVTIGQIFFVIGCYLSSYYLLLIGRIIFGFGGESMLVAKIKMISIWFDHHEVAFAMGCSFSMSRAGNMLNSYLTPIFYNMSNSLFFASFMGFIFISLSFLSGIGMILLDSKAERMDIFEMTLSRVLTMDPQKSLNEPILNQTTDNVGFKDLKNIPLLTWILLIIFAISIATSFGFLGIANDLMQKRFLFTNNEAGLMLSIAFFISTICTPLIGNFIDKFGQRLRLLLFSSLCWGACLLMYMFIPSNTPFKIFYIPIVLLGTFLTIFPTTTFSALCLTVKHDILGLVIGLSGALMNLASAIESLMFGWIADFTIDIHQGYFWSLGFYFASEFVCIINVILSFYLNSKYKTKLNYA